MSNEKKNGLTQSKNRVQIVGTLKEVNLKVDDKVKSKQNPNLVGAIVKEEFKNPAFTIESNGNLYGVEIIPAYKKKVDENGQLVDNPKYKALKTVLEEYETGIRVKVNGSISENGYVGKDGKWVSRSQIQCFSISSSNVPKEDITEGKLSGIIKNMKEEVVNDEETGRLIVELYSVAYDGSVFPVTLYVDEDLAEDVTDVYSKADSVMLNVEIATRTVGKKSDEKRAFGRASKVVEGFDVTEIKIVGGDDPIEDEDSSYHINTDDFKKALKDREVMIDAKIEEKNNNNSANEPKKGLGRRSKIEEDDIEDDPFN